jgi:hypothetical protein
MTTLGYYSMEESVWLPWKKLSIEHVTVGKIQQDLEDGFGCAFKRKNCQ